GDGGGNTGKSVAGAVAALALIVVTGGIASGAAVPFLGASFAAGTLGANALAGAVGLAGALAVSALTPPPALGTIGNTGALSSLPGSDANADQRQPAAASGNVLQPGGAIPRIIGTRKVFPPFGGEPIVELVGDDERVEAFFILNGPHAWSDIRVDGVTIDDAEDVEFETFEGW